MNKMDIDYTAAKFWLDVAQWISIGVIAVWGYLRTKDTDNAQAVGAVRQQLATFMSTQQQLSCTTNERLTRLEERIGHMPTNDELSALEGKIEGMGELLKRIEHQTNIIHEHLLRK